VRCRRPSSAPRRDLLNLEVDLILFDTTSTYFETETVDGLRRRGHSKDHRPDLPQVVIGLAVTKEGIPVRVWVWPGNTTDTTVLVQVRDELRYWSLGRVITVIDRGFSSEDNLAYLRRGGGHWIAGQRMRDGGARAKAALARQGRYHHVRDGLRVKEVRLDDTTPGGDGGRRWIVCHNPDQATRDAVIRDELVAVAEAELDRIATARARTATRNSKARRESEEQAHTAAECTLRDHSGYGRYVRQLTSGRLRIDRARIRDEQRLDGKFLLSTSDPHLPAADVALGYKTCSKPRTPSATSSQSSTCARSSTVSSSASAPTFSSAGSRCCSSASPSTTHPPTRPTPPTRRDGCHGRGCAPNCNACTRSASTARPAARSRAPSSAASSNVSSAR